MGFAGGGALMLCAHPLASANKSAVETKYTLDRTHVLWNLFDAVNTLVLVCKSEL